MCLALASLCSFPTWFILIMLIIQGTSSTLQCNLFVFVLFFISILHGPSAAEDADLE